MHMVVPTRMPIITGLVCLVIIQVVLALIAALIDDPTIAANALILVILAYVTLLSVLKIYNKKASYALDVWSNVSLMAGIIVSGKGNHSINRFRLMGVLGCNVIVFIIIIIYHFCKYTIAGRCKKRPNEYICCLASIEVRIKIYVNRFWREVRIKIYVNRFWRIIETRAPVYMFKYVTINPTI